MKVTKWDGKQIRGGGVYSGMPLSVYHSADVCDGTSVSSSVLRTIFAKSPAHAWAKSPYNPERVEEPEKEAFILGRAAHHLFLGEDDFSTLFIMQPDSKPDGNPWNNNATVCRDWNKAQADAGRTIVTPKQLVSIRGMAKSLAKHPMVRDAGVLNGQIELSIFWEDEETGLWCKSRPDVIPLDSGNLWDFKTAYKSGDDLDWSLFYDLRYDMQGEFARIGLRETRSLEVETFSLVFAEKTAPYCVEPVMIDTVELGEANADLRIAMKAFAWCWERGEWFGPNGTQADGRYAHKSDKARDHAMYRRGILEREMA